MTPPLQDPQALPPLQGRAFTDFAQREYRNDADFTTRDLQIAHRAWLGALADRTTRPTSAEVQDLAATLWAMAQTPPGHGFGESIELMAAEIQAWKDNPKEEASCQCELYEVCQKCDPQKHAEILARAAETPNEEAQKLGEQTLHAADRHLTSAYEALTKLYLSMEPEDWCGDERMDACAKRALDQLTLASAVLMEGIYSARNDDSAAKRDTSLLDFMQQFASACHVEGVARCQFSVDTNKSIREQLLQNMGAIESLTKGSQ